MTPERFREVEEPYHAVRDKSADERAALLARTDPELRREVESLLAQSAASEFLERPAIRNQLREDSLEIPDDVWCFFRVLEQNSNEPVRSAERQ